MDLVLRSMGTVSESQFVSNLITLSPDFIRTSLNTVYAVDLTAKIVFRSIASTVISDRYTRHFY